ncbi:MAG: alpha/beta fold hydrolase [Flavobacteriales bacterium]|jgi:haloalkane dehalogenase|nr:alpha/beta fold hydrolase [Flavobacteriales bacterium]MBK7941708.1 alpha/beta fold hydrolase [Flavobacteriales bacterium]MBK8949266.1 alpha/beta fold hydrolase [Flavobacteriales bacterium]MBK9700250.1 alpha/beta fold hydrolase [Flavobacteriales bacterium]
MVTDITLPAWVDRSALPFRTHTYHHPDGRMHYVDEGCGPVMLFVHGTPDWSFGFRHLITAFAPTHRCIAPDHLGFGLSDKPHGADYTVAAQARRLQRFIDHLGLQDITLVVTDFGGGIGLPHALEHPSNVKRIVLYNTWLWDLMPDKRFSGPTAIMKSGLGRFLYLRMGFSVNVMMPNGYGDQKKLDKATHAHYRHALPDAAARAATFACVQEIKNAGPFWQAQWARVELLRTIPTLLCWGLQDRFFPPDLMERWMRALPHATVRTMPQAGHFLHEEAPHALVDAIRAVISPRVR